MEIAQGPHHTYESADPLEVRPRGGAGGAPRGTLPDADWANVSRRRLIGTTFEGQAAYADGMQSFTSVIPAGLAAIRFGPVKAGEQWLVERIALKSQSVPASSAFVYVVGSGYPLGTATAAEPVQDALLVDATTSGNLDVADENTAIWVPSQHELLVVWTALAGGSAAKCSASVQYRVEAC